MANEWNTSFPIDHTLVSNYPTEIRKLKASAKTQLDHEHETPVDGDATGSEHSNGSAVAFEGASTPTTRPGGANLADNAIDRGRLWLKDTGLFSRWNGAAFVGAGQVIQAVYTSTATKSTPSASTPWDDTIPQKTEGTEIFTLAITPTHASNILEIEVNMHLENANDARGVVALFQDSTANALATVHFRNTIVAQYKLKHRMTAGTTSTTTFKIRIGNNLGTTITVNGQSSNRYYGGTTVSSIKITEYAV